MRPTKSKDRLAYYKHLLALDKKRKELSNRKDDEDNYIEIPRMLIGYRIKLIPVDSLKNRDDGLTEAVEAATSWFRFSDKPFRFCNLKSYRCEFRTQKNHHKQASPISPQQIGKQVSRKRESHAHQKVHGQPGFFRCLHPEGGDLLEDQESVDS